MLTLPEPLSLRDATPLDRDFLLKVYASTRADELAMVPWTDEQKRQFVEQQFAAQDIHYSKHYSDGAFHVILASGEPAGRLYLLWQPNDFRIIDITLLPEFRNRGYGEAILRAVLAEGAASNTPVSIHVEEYNPAQRLYRRLGFKPIDKTGVYLLMEWRQDQVSA